MTGNRIVARVCLVDGAMNDDGGCGTPKGSQKCIKADLVRLPIYSKEKIGMKIETQDIYQADKTEFGHSIVIKVEGDIYLEIDGKPVCCLTTAESKALSNALKTMARMAA